jgi:hypothetical protein
LALGHHLLRLLFIFPEISTQNRGKLGTLFNLILFSESDCFFSNYLFEGFGGAHDWRYMIGIVAVPALV